MSDQITAKSVPGLKLPDEFVENVMLPQIVRVAGGTLAVTGDQLMVFIRITLFTGKTVVVPLPVDAAMMLSNELTVMAAQVEALKKPREKKDN